MRKKIACPAIAAFLLLAFAAGCGAQRGGGAADASSPAGEAAEGAAAKPVHHPTADEVPPVVLPDRDLQCDLQSKPSYRQGERVEMTFKLTNQGTAPLWVLRWNTPLEGLVGDCFEISHDGDVVYFQGRMVKRGMPEAAEYVLIPPGESREGQVDLRAAYKVEAPGSYQLRFDSVLFDVTDDEKLVPRRLEDHQPFDPRCPAVVFEIRPPGKS